MTQALAPLVLFFLFAPAPTPGPGPAPTDQDADTAAYQGKTGDLRVYDFENDTVEGATLSPTAAHVDARVSPRHPSLIRVRAHFIPELIALAREF